MQWLFDWILQNPETAGAIVGALFAILVGAFEVIRRTGSIREALLAAMLRAERARRQKKLGPIDGPAVMDRVITWAMKYLVPQAPIWLRPLLTEKRLREWAQGLYNVTLDLLDDGLLNGTRPALLPDESGIQQVTAVDERLPNRTGGRHV